MRLELRDIESSTVYTVDPSGAVLGRERARTDIHFRDESISKRHARIYAEGDVWYLEDLGSSNGTFLGDVRINAPIQLTQGTTFTLAQRRFEVVYIEGKTAADPLEELAEVEPSPADAGPPGRSLLSLASALPRAVVHFAVTVPVLALNPSVALRRSIEEQRVLALSSGELAVFGGVGAASAVLLTLTLSLVLDALAGHVALGELLAGLPSVGVGVVSGAVSGFLVHPVGAALIRGLRGDSSARSRTNCALDFFGLGILFALPSGLAGLSAFRIPFPGLLPVAATLFVTLLSALVSYRWAVGFGVMRGVRYVIVASGILAVVGAASQAVRSILDAPGPEVVAGEASDLGALERHALLQAEQATVQEARASDPPSSKNELEALETDAGAAPDERVDDELGEAERRAIADTPSDGPSPDAAPGRPEAELPPPGPFIGPRRPGGAESSGSMIAASSADPRVSRDLEGAPRGPAGGVLEAEHPRGPTEYVVFKKKLAAIERAVDDDPGLLDRKDVLDDYQAIWKTTYDVRDRWRRLNRGRSRWEREKINARKEEQEIHRGARRHVDRLYETLFIKE